MNAMRLAIMASITYGVVLALGTIALSQADARSSMGCKSHDADIVRVIDGDTLVADVHLCLGVKRTIKVRLVGVYAPEVRGKEKAAGMRSKAFVEQWVQRWEASEPDFTFQFIDSGVGKYGRQLGDICAPTECLIEQLVEKGFAVRK